MKCKYCSAELEENGNICPVCGKEQTEEIAETAPETVVETATEAGKKQMPRAWKIVLAVVGVLAVAVILTGAILYSMGLTDQVANKFETFFHSLNPWRENDINYRLNYTVKDAKAEEKQDVVVATLGEQQLTNGQLQAFYWMGIFDFVNDYYYYLEDMGLDLSKPLNEQISDEATGETFQQMFLSDAIENWRTYAVLVEMAKKADHQLSEDQKKYLDSFDSEMVTLAKQNGYADVEELIDKDLFPGSSAKAYYEYNSLALTALSYYDVLYEGMMPTMEQMEQYYKDNEATLVGKGFGKDNGNYYDVRHILIEVKSSAEDGKTLSDADWEKCKTDAQKVLDEFLAGDKKEASFAALAAKYSVDTGSNANGGLYSQLTKGTNFVEPFKNWYLDESRKAGDTGLVQSDYGYHVMYFSGKTPIWEYEVKSLVLTDNTTKMMEDAKAQYTLNVDYTKIVLGYVNLME